MIKREGGSIEAGPKGRGNSAGSRFLIVLAAHETRGVGGDIGGEEGEFFDGLTTFGNSNFALGSKKIIAGIFYFRMYLNRWTKNIFERWLGGQLVDFGLPGWVLVSRSGDEDMATDFAESRRVFGFGD